MNPELRIHFGKVAYQAAIKKNGTGIERWEELWEELSKQSKEVYCAVGEAVASELAGMLKAPLQQVLHSFISLIEQCVTQNKENT